MADLQITFGRHIGTPGAPIMDGNKSRTFKLTMSGSNTVSTFAAIAGDNVVRLVAGAACYVDVGAAPVAAAPGSTNPVKGFYMASGGTLELATEVGEKVAVITA